MSKSEYVVLGWKTDPVKGSAIVFEDPKSSDPAADVEQALTLGSTLVTVEASKGNDVERLKREYVETYARVGIRDDKGRYFDPPLLGGVRTYSVYDYVPTGEFHPIEKKTGYFSAQHSKCTSVQTPVVTWSGRCALVAPKYPSE